MLRGKFEPSWPSADKTAAIKGLLMCCVSFLHLAIIYIFCEALISLSLWQVTMFAQAHAHTHARTHTRTHTLY
jgi:hypothetical protein